MPLRRVCCHLNNDHNMKAIYSLILLSTLGTSAIAGTSAKAPAPVAPVAAPSAGITGSLSAGYDTEYYFRGLWFSSNNAWGALNVSVPLADKLTLGLGALYTNGLNTNLPGNSPDLDYSELDLFGSLNYDAGWGKVGLVYTNYQFMDTFSGSVNGTSIGSPNVSDSTLTRASDIGLTLAIPFGAANLYLAGYYDFKIEDTYFEVGADYTFKVSESFSLVPSVQLGYAGSEYYTYAADTGVDSGITHVRVAVSAPYKLTDALTITPYIATNLAQKGREQINTARGKNDFFGGIAVSYSF
jgi:hypothetical protein